MRNPLSSVIIFNGLKICICILFSISISISILNAQQVTTFAGRVWDKDGAGNTASFYNPIGVAIDGSGNIYVADQNNNKIRKITSTGVVSTFAGTGEIGALDGNSSIATFNHPEGITIDASGNLYIADSENRKIRKITPLGIVSTFAGSGIAGSIDATGIAARFNYPTGITIDASNNIYVSDYNARNIRKITSAGVVTTLAGSGAIGALDGNGITATFNGPSGLAIDASGNLFVADKFNNKIRKITSAGIVSTFAGSGTQGSVDATGTSASFYFPSGISIDASGNLYIADGNNPKVRKITSLGVVTTLAGSSTYGSIDGTGSAARFSAPYGICIDATGNLFVADKLNHNIRKVTSLGVVTTLAGELSTGTTNATGSLASFNYPTGVVFDATGNMYVTDYNNHKIRKITPGGIVTTFAGSGIAGSTDATGIAASFNFPYSIAVDGSGNLFVSDRNNHKIRKITPAGVVSSLAGSGTLGSTDATGSAASFNYPQGLAVDPTGNIYVADQGNHKIRKITPLGVVTTFAGTGTSGSTDGTGISASFNSPSGIAIDASNNLFITDQFNQKIRKITPAGIVSSFAGSGSVGLINGTGNSAAFYQPNHIAIDANSNLYVSEQNNKIRRITPSSEVTTFAGYGTTLGSGYVGSHDAIGSLATFNSPAGLAVNSSGDIYLAGYNTQNIRKITLIPEIKVSQSTTELISGTGNYAFGNINLLSSSAATTFTIDNLITTGKQLVLSGTPKVTITGTDFTVNTTATTSPLAIGASTTFTITFTPSSLGLKTATVTILNDDIDEGTYTFTVTGTGVKANQTISEVATVSKVYGTTPFALTGTASSSLPLSYASSNTAVASITGNTVTINSVGTSTITASQVGNGTYNAAPDVTIALTVTQAPLTVTADNKTKVRFDALPTYTLSYSGFVNGDNAGTITIPTISCSATSSSVVGSYPITLSGTTANYIFTLVNGTLTVTTDITGDIDGNGLINGGEIAGDKNNDGTIGAGETAGDKNGNGIIDSGEIAGDKNSNGIIDGGEVAGDQNGNGTIGAGELAGDISGNGTIGAGELSGDKNGNGIIDSGEIAGDQNGNGTIGIGEITGDISGNGAIGAGELSGDKNGNGIIDNGEIAGDINGGGTIGSGEVTGDVNGSGTIGSGELSGDKNGNGIIDNGEISGDKNGSGTIGAGEIAGDINGNGTIDNGEIAGDKNGNGIIDNGEIAGDKNGNGIIDNGEIAGDVNGDGTISNGEIRGDANGNGIIDGSELNGDTNGNGTIDNGESTSTIKSSSSVFASTTVFPNPVADQLTISGLDSPFETKLFTFLGVEIGANDSNQKNIDVSTLAPGIYYLKIISESNEKLIRFTKIK